MKKQAGRKGKFEKWITADGLRLVSGWSLQGATEKEIASKIGISVSTLNEWKGRFPEFSEAIKNGGDVADMTVEAALFKRACGYDWEEITTDIDSNGKKHVRKITRHVQPDTGAAIFWLKNRRRGQWQDKPAPDQEREQYEDDGLLTALQQKSADLFADGDDSEQVVNDYD